MFNQKEYYESKKNTILDLLKPISTYSNINLDYILEFNNDYEAWPIEYLKCDDTLINCSGSSISAVINKYHKFAYKKFKGE